MFVVFLFYVIGILMVFIVIKILLKILFKKDNFVFVVELLFYCFLLFKILWCSMWEKGKGFLCKVGIFIFVGLVIIWLLNYVGLFGFDVLMGESFLVIIGGMFVLLFVLFGFGIW